MPESNDYKVHMDIPDTYYLLILDKQGRVVSTDGSHDTPYGVTEARELIKKLGLRRNGETYLMAHVTKVFDIPVEINQDAVDRCNIMSGHREPGRGILTLEK